MREDKPVHKHAGFKGRVTYAHTQALEEECSRLRKRLAELNYSEKQWKLKYQRLSSKYEASRDEVV